MKSEYQLTLAPVELATAPESVKSILQEQKNNFGFLPNMYTHMANAPSVLKMYLNGYRLFREESSFSSVEQEVLFLTISRENGCDYCVGAHSMIADKMSGVPAHVTEAIRTGSEIDDPRLKALHDFTVVMLDKRGAPAIDDVAAFLSAGFSERQVLEVIVAIAVKTLSNYTNHLAHTALDEVFAGYRWEE
jgi:uncharacterized peroxidase-related enzyme